MKVNKYSAHKLKTIIRKHFFYENIAVEKLNSAENSSRAEYNYFAHNSRFDFETTSYYAGICISHISG